VILIFSGNDSSALLKWLSKTNIDIRSEDQQEKAGYSRIRRKKGPATPDPQDRLRIFQHQIMLSERAVQARRERSRKSKVTPRKHQISLAGKITGALKTNRPREIRPRRPGSPSTSSGDASNCFVCRVKSADFYSGTRNFDDLRFDTTKLHSRMILQNRVII
jgi:hypothetical protein